MAAQAILPSVLDSLVFYHRMSEFRTNASATPFFRFRLPRCRPPMLVEPVAGGRVSGEERGPRGRWAQLRHRISSQCPRRKSQRHSRLTCPMRSTSPHGITHSAWQFDTGS